MFYVWQHLTSKLSVKKIGKGLLHGCEGWIWEILNGSMCYSNETLSLNRMSDMTKVLIEQ